MEDIVSDLVNTKDDGSVPLIVLTCGVAGSGKTTLAILLEEKGFVRLSIDEEIWARYGRFGVDYPSEKYEAYSEEVEKKLRAQLVELIHERKRVVVDFSFWQRVKREEYKKLIEEAGGEWRLLF